MGCQDPSLFGGEHVFALSLIGSGTRLTQTETYRGALVPLFSMISPFSSSFKNAQLSLDALGQALKERVETR